MPFALIALAVIALLVLTGAAMTSYDPAKIRTGNADIDRLPLASAIGRVWGASCPVGIARAVTAIVHLESGGRPAQYLGDTGIASGPSIGPMQVLRTSAIDLGIVPKDISRTEYARYAYDEAAGCYWGCLEFKSWLARASGDIATALQYYNGGMSGSAASQAYREDALTWLSSTFGVNWASEGPATIASADAALQTLTGDATSYGPDAANLPDDSGAEEEDA